MSVRNVVQETEGQLKAKALEIRLTYRGQIPATDKCVPIKHAIRLHFGRQLKELWKRERLLNCSDYTQYPEVPLKGRAAVVPEEFMAEGFHVSVRGTKYIPIVHRWLFRVAEVNIDLYRRDEPGALFKAGGDLDNRLKTLMDALRIPHGDDEIPNGASPPDDGICICVFEDDALITRVSIASHRLLDPPAVGERAESVEAIVHVIAKATQGGFGNTGWLPA